MPEILVGILLVLMIPPALMSVMFASRRWVLILWNFSWYFIMAKAGEFVFKSPYGQWCGIIFAAFYFSRLLGKPRHSHTFVFRGQQFGNLKHDHFKGRSAHRSKSEPKPDGNVIDVEYTVSETTQADNSSSREIETR